MGRQSLASPQGNVVQQAMSKLTAQWYNAVTSQCQLDPQTFQLFQGNVPLGDTSVSLWNIIDVVPPQSVNKYYDPSQLNVFSEQYGAVITNLKAASGGSFEADMGDSYTQWETYLSSQKVTNRQQTLHLFKQWSLEHMDSQAASKCYGDLVEESTGSIETALVMWNSVQNQTKAFSSTIEQLQNAIPQQKSASVNMASATQSSDVSHTWAKGEVYGGFDIFEAAGNANYDQITTQMAQAGITIQAEFQHLLTFPIKPLAQPSDDPELKQYKPWYNAAALSMAYHTKDNTVWNDAPPTWENFFGPKGTMQRACSALVIVDGINITMSSSAAFSKAQQTQVQSGVEAGCWPFFVVSASGGWQHNASFDAQGSVTITQKCPAGNPNVLGAIVTSIASSFS